MGNRGSRIVLLAIAIALAFAASIYADDYRPVDSQEGWRPDNVRAVQEKLRDSGLYFGEIDGTYSSELAAALGRYQIRNGLPITGQLDAETSKTLGAKPAVGPSTAATEQSSETWRGLRKRERRTSTKMRQSEPAATETRETSSPTDNETPPTGTEPPIQTTPVEARSSAESAQPAPAPPATGSA